MNVYYVFIICVIGLGLLIFHSYVINGTRITVNFFLFAFIAGMRKEVGTFLSPAVVTMKHLTPFVHTNDIALKFAVINTTLGWVLAFYISWVIGARIAGRSIFLKKKVFPTILWSGITIAALSYAIETTAINIGWWQWKFHESMFANYFVGGTHFFAINAWFHFYLYFLIPFILIECTWLKNKKWKLLFLLIPFSRTCTMIFLGSHMPRIIYELILFYSLVGFAFLNSWDVYIQKREKKSTELKRYEKGIVYLPDLVISEIVLVLIGTDVYQAHNFRLLISILPLLCILILSIPRVPLWFVLTVTGACVFIFGPKGIPVVIPVLSFMLLEGVRRYNKIHRNAQ